MNKPDVSAVKGEVEAHVLDHLVNGPTEHRTLMDGAMTAAERSCIAYAITVVEGMGCYRVNWERETRELTCRALINVSTNSSAPFRATQLCPSCNTLAQLRAMLEEA